MISLNSHLPVEIEREKNVYCAIKYYWVVRNLEIYQTDAGTISETLLVHGVN